MAILVTISYMLRVPTATTSRAGRRSFVFSLPAADRTRSGISTVEIDETQKMSRDT